MKYKLGLATNLQLLAMMELQVVLYYFRHSGGNEEARRELTSQQRNFGDSSFLT